MNLYIKSKTELKCFVCVHIHLKRNNPPAAALRSVPTDLMSV